MTVGVAVLGSTGSIGTSALSVLARHRDRFRVVALTANSNRELLEIQSRAWSPQLTGLVSESVAGWASGAACLVEAATHPAAQIVINGVVGAAGLEATIAALRAGKRVALANKETLVMAGEIVAAAAREGGGELVPVDSEHAAVVQCMAGRRTDGPTDRRTGGLMPGLGVDDVSRIILTASGGPFHNWESERIYRATVTEALNHPTWTMGRKISIDSATLANKALEVIEAHFLFGIGYEKVTAVVHPQSIIHSFVEFVDGSVLAQLGFPDMELPILYALSYPERLADDGVTRFDPVAVGTLTFEPIRSDAFPAFALGVRAGRTGGTAPAVFNAANEVAVASFLRGAIPFGRIAEVIERVLSAHTTVAAESLEIVLGADSWARSHAETVLAC